MTSHLPSDTRIAHAVVLYNAGKWRDALLVFEDVWVETRDVELKVLIQLANLTLQLHQGFIMSPRKLVARALELLDEASGSTGVDLQALRQTLHELAAIIPANDTDLIDIRVLPHIQLRWLHGSN